MKTITALAEHLNTARTFREKYPQFNENDKKIHVLFLSPCLNETGLYRMILPALELNKTDTHCAILAHIHKWDFHKWFDDYDNPVSLQLVKWADYVVLPTMFSDAGYIVESMRAVNNDIEFIMDLDLNYHALPDFHPLSKTLTTDSKAILLNNLSFMDLVTAPNMTILHNYISLAKNSPKMFKFCPEYYGNLVSNFCYEDTPQFFRNTTVKIRIGILMERFLPEDLKTIEEPLIRVLATHKDAVELIVYGWNEKMRVRENILPGVDITYRQIVNTNALPACINELSLDIGLIPFANNTFNRSGRVFNRFLDFSGVMVPTIMPAVTPFTKFIKDGENGFLATNADEWEAKLTKLIHDADLRLNVGQQAFQFVWEAFSYVNPRAIKRLQEVFA